MVKKPIAVVVVALLIFSIIPGLALGAQVSLDLDKSSMVIGDNLTASGSADPSVWVSIKVLDSSQSIVFFDTVKSNASGNYTCTFKLPSVSSGTLTVVAGYGSNVASKTFTAQGTTPVEAKKDETIALDSNTPVTITVPQTASGTKIKVNPQDALPLVQVKTVTSLGQVEIAIPEGTKVTGPANWNGEIKLPEVKSQASASVSGAQSVAAVIEVGLSDQIITFSKAVRLLVPGQSGKSAGYIRNGTFTAITRTLSADTQAIADSEIPANGDGVVNTGNDLVLWTKHFTEFVAYTPASNPSGGGGGGGGGAVAAPGQTVTSSGTTVSDLGATIVIPANAVSSDIKVSISKVSATSSLTLPANGKFAGEVFDITKDKSGKFDKVVSISLPYDKSKIDTSKEDLALYWWDDSKWVKLDNVKVDESAGKVSGEADHFTKFTVIAVAKTVVPAATQAPAENAAPASITLPDLVGHWAEKNVRELVASGSISGYPDGSFKPNKTITRAEFAAVLAKAYKLPLKAGKVFSDTGNHWAKDYIAAATAAGIVNGYSADKFGPDDPITREQMAVMVYKAAKLKASAQNLSFTDSKQIASWAREAVAAAAAKQVISGYPDNSFKPRANTTRAEAVSAVCKALK